MDAFTTARGGNNGAATGAALAAGSAAELVTAGAALGSGAGVLAGATMAKLAAGQVGATGGSGMGQSAATIARVTIKNTTAQAIPEAKARTRTRCASAADSDRGGASGGRSGGSGPLSRGSLIPGKGATNGNVGPRADTSSGSVMHARTPLAGLSRGSVLLVVEIGAAGASIGSVPRGPMDRDGAGSWPKGKMRAFIAPSSCPAAHGLPGPPQ